MEQHKSEAVKKDDDDDDDEQELNKVETLSSSWAPLVSFSFRKNFYTDVNSEIQKMNPEEVLAYREQLELEVVGNDVPDPIKTWHEAPLEYSVFDTLTELNYVNPTPIQTQALPVIMSGRDCIAVAGKGSGKTLAYVLPMLRQLVEPATRKHGPIGLIIAPTKEHVQKIDAVIKTFIYMIPCLTCVPVYTSGVLEKVSELRTGPGIVVCTPELSGVIGRGEIMKLTRVTYLVLDDADRMIEMGFEPQIAGIRKYTRRRRQTVVFSATFPSEVKTLANKITKDAVEIHHHVVKQQVHHGPGGGGGFGAI